MEPSSLPSAGVVVATGGSYHLMPLQVDEVGGARKEDHTHMVTMVWLVSD